MKSVNLARKLPSDILRVLYRLVEPGLLYLPSPARRRFKTAPLAERDLKIRASRAAGASLEALARTHSRSLSRISEICRGVRRSGARFRAPVRGSDRAAVSKGFPPEISPYRWAAGTASDSTGYDRATERVSRQTQPPAAPDGPTAGRGAVSPPPVEPGRGRGCHGSTKMTTTMTVKDAVARLGAASANDLAWIYKRATGAKPPKAARKATVLESLVDALREKAAGDGDAAVLSEEAAGWLGEVGDAKAAAAKAEAADAPAAKPARAAKEPKVRDERLPQVGEEIRKTWRDRELVVKCLEDGFEFEGKTYRSLSKIATELLGCSANGFLFFALTGKQKAAAAAKAAREQAAVEAPKPEKAPKKAKTAKGKSSKKAKAKSK